MSSHGSLGGRLDLLARLLLSNGTRSTAMEIGRGSGSDRVVGHVSYPAAAMVDLASRALLVASLGLLACEAEVDDVPEGALVLVGDQSLYPEDLGQVQGQLGAYAQTRFRGPHGQRALLDALVDASLLSQEAVDAGMARDPRAHWALVEEMATLRLNAELERRLPRAEVAADTEALHAYYQQHLAEFTEPERRSLEGVRFSDLREAEAALARLRAGEVELAELGEVVTTPLARRDDATFPGFHVFLFDASLGQGDWLAVPVLTDRAIVVGRVAQLVPAKATPAEDPAVWERLVNRVWEERSKPVRAALLAELAERYPAETR